MKSKILILLCLQGTGSLFASMSPQLKGCEIRATPKTKEEIRQMLREAGQADAQRRREKQQASREEASEIPNQFVMEEQKEQEGEGQCAICLEQLQAEGILKKTLHCHPSHTFHTVCIDQWLASNPRCPMCRTILPQNEIPQVLIPNAQAGAGSVVANLLNQANRLDASINARTFAQLNLGAIYRHGQHGVAQNFVQSVQFLNQANRPDAPIYTRAYAQVFLGAIYREGGYGVTRDYVLAEQFLNQGNQVDAPIYVQRHAQLYLGQIYREGGNGSTVRNLFRFGGAHGIVRNLFRAEQLLSQANQPDAPINVQRCSQLNLGAIYREGGNGIPRNHELAVQFLNQANQADAPIDARRHARLYLGAIYRDGGHGIPRNPALSAQFFSQVNNELEGVYIFNSYRRNQLERVRLELGLTSQTYSCAIQ